jgi:hypothetical protein
MEHMLLFTWVHTPSPQIPFLLREYRRSEMLSLDSYMVDNCLVFLLLYLIKFFAPIHIQRYVVFREESLNWKNNIPRILFSLALFLPSEMHSILNFPLPNIILFQISIIFLCDPARHFKRKLLFLLGFPSTIRVLWSNLYKTETIVLMKFLL